MSKNFRVLREELDRKIGDLTVADHGRCASDLMKLSQLIMEDQTIPVKDRMLEIHRLTGRLVMHESYLAEQLEDE